MPNSNLKIDTLEELELLTGIKVSTLFELAENIHKHVRVSFEPKKSGKGYREICRPSEKLKKIQKHLNQRLLRTILLPNNLQGGVPGKSPKSNAQFHTQKPVVVTLDIKDFFPSIRYERVFDLFINIGCSSNVSRVLTRITTYNYHLAQGFPTSSTIANLILADILPRITKLCQQYQITFTTYQDNLYFSGTRRVRKFSSLFSKIFRQEGYKTHEEKTMSDNDRQMVSGYVVNRKVNINRQEYRILRATLHRCKTNGIEAVADRPIDKYIMHLKGRIQRVIEVNPRIGQSLLEEF